MIKKIKQLLDSSIPNDIILAMELMRIHLTVDQVKEVIKKRDVPHGGCNVVAFKISKNSFIAYNNSWIRETAIPNLDKKEWIRYLGKHHELKNKDNVQD